MVSENAVYLWTDVKGDKISFLKISGYLWTGPESGINAVQVEDIHFVIDLSFGFDLFSVHVSLDCKAKVAGRIKSISILTILRYKLNVKTI